MRSALLLLALRRRRPMRRNVLLPTTPLFSAVLFSAVLRSIAAFVPIVLRHA